MSQQVVDDIKNKLWALSRDELLDINALLISISKAKRKGEIVQKKNQLSVGDKVQFTTSKGETILCELLELRRTKATVRTTNFPYERWNVPINLLSPREAVFDPTTGEFR